MAANLGTLTLNMIVQTGAYVAGMKRIENQTRNSTDNMAKGFDLVGLSVAALKGVVAGISVAGVASFAVEVIRAGNEVKKLADLSNTSISQFQYYSKGAATAGIDIAKFADQLKDMQDRIGDFQQTGGGPLADFFENIAPKVGVTIQQFQKLSGPEALQLFYDSLEKVGSTKNDITFYMESIISDSALLVPLLEKGGKGFKEWGDRAKEAGAIMSDDMVSSLVEGNKNLEIMDLQWQGIRMNLVNDIIPAFQYVTENLDTIKAVAVGLAAAIGAKLVVQGVVLAGVFTMAAIRAGVMEASLISLQGATASTAISMGVLRGATAFLGGPAGLALLAIQAIAAGGAYYAFKKSTDSSTISLNEHRDSVEGLIKKYDELSVSQKNAFSYQETKDLEQKTEEYTKARAAFYDSAVGIAYAGAQTKDQVAIIDGLVSRFKDGKISAIDFADGMQNLGVYTKEQINTAVIFAQKTEDSKNALDSQKKVVEALSKANSQMTKSQKEQTKAVNESALAWMSLSKKQRDALDAMKNDMLRQQYKQNTVKNGWSVEQAEAFAGYRDSAGIGFTSKDKLSQLERDMVIKSFNSKNYNFTKSDLAAIAKVQGIAKTNNFAEIEQMYGLPVGTLAALVLQESRGNENAVSPTGAKGLFQTTSIFRKQYGLTSNSSIEEQAIAAAKDLANNRNVFGSPDKMFMAYNAGIGGLKSYLAGGLSDSKRKEVADYAPGVQKWLAGVNGKSTIDNSIVMPSQADLLTFINNSAEAKQALIDKRKEVDESYFKESEVAAKEHEDRLEKITLAYAGSPDLKNRIQQENEFYSAQSARLIAEKQNEYNQYFAFETDRITQIERDFKYQKAMIETNVEYDKKAKDEILAALERQKQQQIAWEKLEQEQRISDAGELLRTDLQNMEIKYNFERRRILENSEITLGEQEKLIALSKAAQESQNRQNLSSAWENWGVVEADLAGTGSQYQIEQDRFSRYKKSDALFESQIALAKSAEEREAIWKAHNDRMFEIDKQYDLDTRNLSMSQYADALGAATGFFGEMLGRSSGTYKALYFAQKSFALSQAGMNVFKSASDAYANEPGTVWQKLGAAALATVKSSSFVSLIQAATPQGFATGGQILGPGTGTSDSIPIMASNKEYMIRAAAAEKLGLDTLNYINQTGELPKKFATGGAIGEDVFERRPVKFKTGFNQSGDVNVRVNVTDTGNSTQGATAQDQRQLGQLIANAVRAVIRQEQRQGGLLSK